MPPRRRPGQLNVADLRAEAAQARARQNGHAAESGSLAGRGKPGPDGLTDFRPAEQARLGIVEQIYCYPPGAAPTLIDLREGFWLETDEQPYQRKLKVGTEWQPLDCGWLEGKGVSLLVLVNEEGKHLTVVPSEQQKAAVSGRVVELGVQTMYGMGDAPGIVPIAPLRPGLSLRFAPADAKALRLRSRAGEARVTLTLFPA